MDDRFDNLNNHYDYEEHDNESDDNGPAVSSDEEQNADIDYFLTIEAGKDIIKEKGNFPSSSASGSQLDEKIVLGQTVKKDDLFYDADIDKQNQEWMDRKRKKNSSSGGETSSALKAPKSDAILSCPGCMVTVCIDCQRHDIYKTQFRAMFVICYVVADEVLKYETKNKSKKRRKKEGPGKLVPVEKDSEEILNKNLEIYNPVKCDCCQTELAVYDKNEIYHFHNVLESLS